PPPRIGEAVVSRSACACRGGQDLHAFSRYAQLGSAGESRRDPLREKPAVLLPLQSHELATTSRRDKLGTPRGYTRLRASWLGSVALGAPGNSQYCQRTAGKRRRPGQRAAVG